MDSSFSPVPIGETTSQDPTSPPLAKAPNPAPTRKKESKYLFLFIMYFVLALPALGLFVAHKITDNPLLQPLGLDKDSIAEYERSATNASIFVHVNWGTEHPGTPTQQDLRNLVSSGMVNRTDNYVFRFKDVPGTKAEVTFVVGPNSYGPYPPASMINGIIPALAALELTQRGTQ